MKSSFYLEAQPRRFRSRPANYLFVVVGCFLLLCLLGGGASRASDIPLVLIRPAAVGVIGLALAITPANAFVPYRVPLLILGLFAVTMGIQLIPLPPSLWRLLPLSATYADMLAATGLSERWRPASITPDLTVNSLLSLLPPCAALIGIAALSERARFRLPAFLLAGIAASCVLGLAQFAGGPSSPLYFWSLRSEGVADGVFANRNHHGVFIVCGLALLGAWVVKPAETARIRTLGSRLLVGIALAVLFLATVVATGSRTATVLAVVATGYSYWVVIRSGVFASYRAHLPRLTQQAIRSGWVSFPLLFLIMLLAGRATSFQRLAEVDAASDQRISSFPIIVDMAKSTFPWGSGFGSFDPLFRIFEPDGLLRFTYFNHAHDDFLELLIVGGLPAMIVVGLAFLWWGRAAARAFTAGSGSGRAQGRAAAVAMLLVAIASAVDYPVRTPLIGCLLAMLTIWLADASQRSRKRTNVALNG